MFRYWEVKLIDKRMKKVNILFNNKKKYSLKINDIFFNNLGINKKNIEFFNL